MPARRSRWAAAATLRALWAVVLATGLVAPLEARAQAPTDGTPSESLWTRDTLGGDWGGFRGALGQHGVTFDLRATGFFQDMLDEQGIEAYYTFVPTRWLRLSANLQWVNPAYGANPSVWLGALRAQFAF